MHTDLKQIARMNTFKDVSLAYVGYSLFFIFAYFIELINISTINLITLLTFVWSGNIITYLIFKTNLNLKLSDQDLIVHMIFWAIVCIILPTYFMSSTLRSVFIMNYFIVMVFGSFKLNLKQFIVLTSIAVIGLGFVISIYMKNFPSTINLYDELLLWCMFSFVAFSFAAICNSISVMRFKLNNQKKELLSAFSDIQKISVTDELTGIYNRRYALDFIANMKLKTDRGMDRFVICIVDIDFFKHINDNHGHDVGDVVLKQFSDELNKLIRHDDCLSRFGGEEFLLVLAHVDNKIATEVLTRIITHIRNIKFERNPKLKLTASIGATSYEINESIDTVIKRADELLYEAKNNGRDQFIIR